MAWNSFLELWIAFLWPKELWPIRKINDWPLSWSINWFLCLLHPLLAGCLTPAKSSMNAIPITYHVCVVTSRQRFLFKQFCCNWCLFVCLYFFLELLKTFPRTQKKESKYSSKLTLVNHHTRKLLQRLCQFYHRCFVYSVYVCLSMWLINCSLRPVYESHAQKRQDRLSAGVDRHWVCEGNCPDCGHSPTDLYPECTKTYVRYAQKYA